MLRRGQIVSYAAAAAALCTVRAHGQSAVYDPWTYAQNAIIATESENWSNLTGAWGGLDSQRLAAMDNQNEVLGPPQTATMTISAGTDSPAAVAQDNATLTSITAHLAPDSVLKQRLNQYVLVRGQNAAFRAQLQQLSEEGKPALGWLERVKLSTQLRALGLDQLNAALLSFATDAAQRVQQGPDAPSAKQAEAVARQQQMAGAAAAADLK